MAACSTKLTVVKGSTTQSVTSYTTTGEATVKTASGGTYWQIVNNGTTAYIGLWPTSVTSGGHPYHSNLQVVKGGKTYYVETQVNNKWTLTLAATSGQTITLKYTQPGSSAVTKTSTSKAQSFTVEHGTTWTASVAGATGYNPGKLSPGTSGTIASNVTVSASAASIKSFKITFSYSNSNYKNYVKVAYTNASGSSASATGPASVTVRYGTKITLTCPVSYGYYRITIAGTQRWIGYDQSASFTTGAITAAATYSVTGAWTSCSCSSCSCSCG